MFPQNHLSQVRGRILRFLPTNLTGTGKQCRQGDRDEGLGQSQLAWGPAHSHSCIRAVSLCSSQTNRELVLTPFISLLWPHLSLPPCFNPSTWRLILLNIQSRSQEGCNMINYRLSAAVSVYYIMQTLVQTHIRFLDAAPVIFPFSLDATLFLSNCNTLCFDTAYSSHFMYFFQQHTLFLKNKNNPTNAYFRLVFRELSPMIFFLPFSNQRKK